MPIHVRAEKTEVAPYVLLPGDPERAEYIANKFLTHAKRYTSYRQMYGYTGLYNDLRVSIQTSGMGTPSASIIITELFELGVEAIIRVGTCGGLQTDLQLADLLLVQSAWSSREIVSQITQSSDFVPNASWDILKLSEQIAAKQPDINYRIGSVASNNLFYDPNRDYFDRLQKLGCLACEMEAAALFSLAAVHKKHAGCLLTVSDLIHGKPEDFVRATEEKITTGVDKMVKIALDTFVEFDQTGKKD